MTADEEHQDLQREDKSSMVRCDSAGAVGSARWSLVRLGSVLREWVTRARLLDHRM